MRIAVVANDSNALDLIEKSIDTLGHECLTFLGGEALLRTTQDALPIDLLVLDWSPSEVHGIDMVQWAHVNIGAHVPILLMAGGATERCALEGLSAGADDCLLKPIRRGELRARVRALLRRCHAERIDKLDLGPYCFDPVMREVSINGVSVELGRREFDVALLLFRNLGKLVSRDRLLEAIAGKAESIDPRSLATHISRIRVKLDLQSRHGLLLSAAHRRGYRLKVIGEYSPGLTQRG